MYTESGYSEGSGTSSVQMGIGRWVTGVVCSVVIGAVVCG